jgi:PPM family protein phosphatase
MSEVNQDNSDRDTMEFDQPRSTNLNLHQVASALVQVDLAAQSHQGHVRDQNEDHYLAVRATRSLETVLSNLPEDLLPGRSNETAYGMLVADGMGGAAAGEVASSVALLKLLELVVQTPDWFMKMNQRENATIVMQRMTDRFRQIDDELREQGETNRSLHGMGTTLTAAVSLGTDLFLSHIGDSRAYLLRGEKLHQLTKDHTLAQALIEAGIAAADNTSTRAMRHVLTAALGATGERADPQVQRLHLSEGDQLLLCTDGLSEMVADDIITSVLTGANSSESACQELVDMALAAGGIDNITVVLARYRFPPDGLESERVIAVESVAAL